MRDLVKQGLSSGGSSGTVATTTGDPSNSTISTDARTGGSIFSPHICANPSATARALKPGTAWKPARSANPRTTTPPDVFENALSVSAILFGSP